MRSFLGSLVIVCCTVACTEDLLSEESRVSVGAPQEITVLSEASKDDNAYSERPELIFTEDKVTLTREVFADDILIVRYDLSRMSDCKADRRGYLPVLTGYYQVDDQVKQSFEYTPNVSTTHRVQSTSIQVPSGEQLSFSFQMVDNNDCEAWDSNLDVGYRIQIKQAEDSDVLESSLVTFQSDGEVSQSAPIQSGSLLRVKYKLDRLLDCESYQNGRPQWGITGHYKSNLTDEEIFQATEIVDGELRTLEVTLEVPEGDELLLWFTASNRYGCFQEDSGASFEIE